VNTAVDLLAEGVGQLLSKTVFDKDDSILVRGHNTVDLPCLSLDRLRPGRWLDMPIIGAAMEITDKPSFVEYGLSVPLDEKINDIVTRIVKPFGLWRKKIDEYKREAGSNTRSIFFCPVNTNTDHFTLLEINEQMQMIYHYDSMATSSVIRGRGRAKPTRVREAVEVS
jgi:hypothetical protein